MYSVRVAKQPTHYRPPTTHHTPTAQVHLDVSNNKLVDLPIGAANTCMSINRPNFS